MKANHPALVLTAIATVLVAAACSSGKKSTDTTPQGTHHHYIINTIEFPTTSNQFGFDLDGNGSKDNAFGNFFFTLQQAGAADFQPALDQDIQVGKVLLLADLQATDLTNASRVGFATLGGANPVPAPCTVPTNLSTCGQHLSGSGSFDIDPSAPLNAQVRGAISAGGFDDGAPGELLLRMSMGGHSIDVTLVSARAHLTGITAGAIGGGSIGGAIRKDDLDNKVLPQVAAFFGDLVTRDCVGSGPPSCGCAGGSTGAALIGLFDTNHDCGIATSELQASALLVPDINIAGTGSNDALSFGVGVTGTGATFTQP